MKKSSKKICKMPGCQKETYDNKSLFCGQHKREVKQTAKKTGELAVGAIGIATVVIGAVGKKIKK